MTFFGMGGQFRTSGEVNRGLVQLAVRPFQGVQLLRIIKGNTRAPPAADLRPLGRRGQHQPNRAFAYLGSKSVRGLADGGSSISGAEPSGKPGSVPRATHSLTPTYPTLASAAAPTGSGNWRRLIGSG